MENVFKRKDFVSCMQQLRLMNKFEIERKCLDGVVKAVNIVLDACYTHKDGYSGKQIMVLIFTYFILEPDTDPTKTIKLFLQHFVKEHRIWSEKQFWDSAFIESIYEQSRQKDRTQADIITRANSGISFEKEQNLVFNQLAYYVHNMVLFNIPTK